MTTTSSPGISSDLLHAQIQSFYAQQMQLLDASRTTEWAETFTEDGVFATNVRPEAAAGRQVIAAAAAAARAELAAAGLTHRHWLGMLTVHPQHDGTVLAHSYALVIETPRGGSPSLRHSTRCDDVLVPAGAAWQVRHRLVSRDDIG